MLEILNYSFFWRTKDNQGTIQLALANGQGATLTPQTPAEAMLLVDILRNEKPVYYCAEHEMLMTGPEPVGEGEG